MTTDTRKRSEIKVSSEPVKKTSIVDGLVNLATGLGTNKDKSIGNTWYHSGKNFDHVSLSARFREDWVSQKICKILPQDMTREWRSFKSENAKDADEQFDVNNLFQMAYQWARLYGTSFIVMDINDGRSPDKPVRWDKLAPGCIRSMHVVDRTRIVATGEIEQDPMAVQYGMPTNYQFVNMSTTIHIDRLIRFEGTELPIYERMRNLWYSDSVLIPLLDLIDNFHSTSSAVAQMAQEANIDVVSIEGLGEILANDKGTNALLERFSIWKQIKSVFGVTIMDSKEEYDQKNMQLGGVKDVLWQYLEVVAAAVGIPVTRFLSVSPTGLSNTGHADIVNYVEMLRGLQEQIFTPRLLIIDKLLAAHFGLDASEFKFEYCDIFPESTAEKSVRLKDASEGLSNLVLAGIVSAQSCLDKLIADGHFPKEATVGKLPPTGSTGGDK